MRDSTIIVLVENITITCVFIAIYIRVQKGHQVIAVIEHTFYY